MDDIIKTLVDNAIDRDIEQWLGQSEEGEKLMLMKFILLLHLLLMKNANHQVKNLEF